MSKVFRRDPRHERIQRNRLHPLHLVNQSQASVASSGATPTIEPKDWDSSRLPLHRVENPEFYIVVVPEMSGGRLTSADKDMLGLAQQLANGGLAHDRMDDQKIENQAPERRGAVLVVVFFPR